MARGVLGSLYCCQGHILSLPTRFPRAAGLRGRPRLFVSMPDRDYDRITSEVDGDGEEWNPELMYGRRIICGDLRR